MANILVVGPHPDDQELGMGGTIAKMASLGHDVLLLDITDGEPTPYGDPVTRAGEADAAAKILSPDPAEHPGGKPVRRVTIGLQNRLVEHTIAARHAVAGVMRAHQSDVVFAPYFEDAHPDHRAVTRIVEDARFDAKLTKLEMPTPQGMTPGQACYPRWLFYYYATHLRWVADPSFLMDITGFLDRKLESIRAYRTQFVLPEKNRGVVEWVEASGRYFGSRIGVTHAEPFFTKEPVGLSDLGVLVGL
ncbi:MAG: bacillithiol biosynthesis deacetylase BshB1 [Phycisphaerales bacterium]|nr:MAG: bacillithiol biosynthesis deacetylase BshB1 [Phycisphaerales bacterium]